MTSSQEGTIRNHTTTLRLILAFSTIVVSVAGPAGAQITFDSAASGSNIGTSLSWSHTVGSGADRILVVGLASSTGVPYPSAISVTYGGQPLTRQVLSTPLSPPNIEIWTLVAPVTGTATIVAMFPGVPDIAGGSVSFSGVDQVTPIRANNSAKAAANMGSGTISTSVTSTPGDVVIDALAAFTSGPAAETPAMGQTLRWNGGFGGGLSGVFGNGSTKPGAAGSTTVTWNFSAAAPPILLNVALAAISIIQAQADLSITNAVLTPVVGGQSATYTITVINNGPSQATGVTVNDIAPPAFTFVSNTGGCTTAFPCNLGTLSKGQSVTIQATFTVPANFQGTSNTATVSSSTPDPNQANNTATVSNGPTVTPLPSTLLLVCVGLAALTLWNPRRLLR